MPRSEKQSTKEVTSATDQKYMHIALAMARRGLGQTSPNPSVGAVIVKKIKQHDLIVGRGNTGKGGTPHAEPNAIANAISYFSQKGIIKEAAGGELNGATLYVTLEPCNHHGRTPPCTETIITAGIKRVVIASTDLDQRVQGSGIERLRQAGIEVTTGVCKTEADVLNAGHFLRQQDKRPFIIVKTAIGSNGLINSADAGAPSWVTGEQARLRGHLLRAEVDAILIGRATAELDNPTLTCRLKGMIERSPQPVIIDQNLKLKKHLKLFQPNNRLNENGQPQQNNPQQNNEQQNGPQQIWVLCSNQLSKQQLQDYQQKNIRLIPVSPKSETELNLNEALSALSDLGITRLLVEGGPKTAKSFLSQTPVDQLNIFQGGEPASPEGLLPFGDKPLSWPTEELSFILDHQQQLGHNIMYQYRRS